MGSIIEELIEEGRVEGESCILQLIQELNASGRMDDVLRMTTDKSYRDQLLKEFSLLNE